MADRKSTLWNRSHIVDSFHRPAQGGRLVLAVAILIFVTDAIIGLALPNPFEPVPDEIESASQLREYLSYIADRESPWLLIGDSVLAGNVIANRVPDWNRHRVVDYMRSELASNRRETFHQVALDGMLPVDINRILTELDRVDPACKVSLAIEINPRYFSRRYVHTTDNTREWLSAVGRPSPSPSIVLAGALEWMRPRIPLLRHIDRFGLRLPISEPEGLAPRRGSPPEENDLAGQARVLEHYRELAIDGGSAQEDYFDAILDRIARNNRKALLFTTPLNDAIVSEVLSESDYGRYLTRLTGHVSRHDASLRIVHLDAPMFVPEMFIDHSHLLPSGQRMLAINLLHEARLPLSRVPSETEIVYPEGEGVTFVWNPRQGHNDGAAWQVKFNQPSGIILHEKWGVIIADTGNHCIRRFDLESRLTTTITGEPGVAGGDDGTLRIATFTNPSELCANDEAVFVVDGNHTRIRRITRQGVTTLRASDLFGKTIQDIDCQNEKLFVLVDNSRIIECDTKRDLIRTVMTSANVAVKRFDLSAQGDMYLATVANEIWVLSKDVLKNGDGRLENGTRLFSNSGDVYQPDGTRTFPIPINEVKFADIVDIVFVERYKGILVVDNLKVGSGINRPRETIHLKFINPVDKLVYPWVKPYVFGKANDLRHFGSAKHVSLFQEGGMTLDQETAAVYWVDKERSRLYAINDGIWGAARIGNMNNTLNDRGDRVSDAFGLRAGEYIYRTFKPYKHLGAQIQSHSTLAGPYTGVIVGSSLTATSDMAPQYSFGRALEKELQLSLAYKDRIKYEQISRVRTASTFGDNIGVLEQFLNDDGRADVIFVCSRLSRLPDQSEWFRLFRKLLRLSAQYDSVPIILDVGSLSSFNGEGLKSYRDWHDDFYASAARAGIHVIRPSNVLLRDYLNLGPIGSPPYPANHASPWAIDKTASIVAELVYPIIRERLAGRVPAFRREPLVGKQVDDADYLVEAVAKTDIDWNSFELPYIDNRALTRRFKNGVVSILVDVSKAGYGAQGTANDELTKLVLAVIYQSLVLDPSGALATGLEVTLVNFSNYDEYGEGVLESAAVLFNQSFDDESLLAFVERFRANQ